MFSYTGDGYQPHQDHYANLDPELFDHYPLIGETIDLHYGPASEPRYNLSSLPTHLFWCFRVGDGIKPGQAIGTRDIKTEWIPNTDERFRKMLESINDLGLYKAPKEATKKYEALRSDLQRLHIIEICKDAEANTSATWSVAGIDTDKRTRRIHGKQVRETCALYAMLKREPNRQDSISIFSSMPAYTKEQIDQMEWDVPDAPRKEMRQLGQCLHCAAGKKKCSDRTCCSECERKELPCISGNVWSINVFAYGTPIPESPPQVLAKRPSAGAELPKLSHSLLGPIEYMPIDVDVRENGGGSLAQLDLLFTTAMNEAFSKFFNPIGTPQSWCDAQTFVFQHRGPLYLLLESNVILVYSHLIQEALEVGDRWKCIHELRAKAGKAVLAELKVLLEREHLAIVRKNLPWCSDLVTYIILVLKAALELGDSIHAVNTEEIAADIQKLQQALCFFMQDLGSSAFGKQSPFLSEFCVTKEGVSMRETIWAVLAKEKFRTIERSKTSPAEFDFYKTSLSSLNDPEYYDTFEKLLTSYLDDSLPSSEWPFSKTQRTDSGGKSAQRPSRARMIEAGLEEQFQRILPIRGMKAGLFGDGTNASSENGIDPISQYALSIPGPSIRGDSMPAPERFHPDDTDLVVVKSDNPFYGRIAESGDVFTLKTAHLLCNRCWRSYAIHKGIVLFECEESVSPLQQYFCDIPECCYFSIGWFYYLVDIKGRQLVGDVRQGMKKFDDLVPNGLVPSGRVKKVPLTRVPLAEVPLTEERRRGFLRGILDFTPTLHKKV
ncbi:hypothetical protein EG329_008665 [Mollisiaceae sp. DMI_Dod_QoI]|nr:hypothetical protein EG329_008665 [Helotiales sp. DMI_Dod_QoI]